MRTYVRMPPPYPVVRARLDHAIARRDLAAIRSAARDLPSAVTLVDAVEALDALPASDAQAMLTGLLTRHGLR